MVLCLGGEDLGLRLAFLRALQSAGLSVGAVGVGPDHRFVEAGIPYYSYSLKRTCAPLTDWQALWRVILQVARSRPAIVHGFDTKPGLIAPLAVSISRQGCAIRTINGLGRIFATISGSGGALRAAYCGAQRLVAPLTAVTIFQNQHDLTFFARRSLVNRRRAVVIPGSGVDVHAFSRDAIPASAKEALRSELGLEGKFVVSCVARMTRQKGIRCLLSASHLIARERSDVRVLLVGPSESEASEAITVEEIRRHSPPVTALGPRNDVAQILAVTDVFVLPTAYAEGVPRSLLEAGAMGIPLVTTTMPGCTDVVVDGWNGFLIEPGDPYGLAASVLQLAGNECLRRSMGERSRRRICERFSLERVTAAHLEIYQCVLEQRPISTLSSGLSLV